MSKEKRIYFYVSSDVHSHIVVSEGAPYGLARIASFLAHQREMGKSMVVVDNGDYIQGTPLASFMALRAKPPTPKPLIEALNLAGYDYFNLGNHEFNFGQDYLKEAINLFKGKVLCANCVDDKGEVALGQPYDIIEKDGIKIGLIGLITSHVPKWEQPEYISGLTFLDSVETAKKWARVLRPEVDALLVTYHGGPDKDLTTGEKIGLGDREHDALRLIDEVEELDAIFCGHQHRSICALYKGKPLLSPNWRGSHLSELVLIFEDGGKGYRLKALEPKLISMEASEASQAMQRLMQPWQEKVNTWLEKPLGYATKDMQINDVVKACSYNHPYLDLVNTIQLESTKADISATSFFALGVKGLDGHIYVKDVVNNYTYSNSLKVLKITGSDLKAALERSASFFVVLDGQLGIRTSTKGRFVSLYNYDIYKGIRYTFDVSKPVGERVVELYFKDKPVSPEDEFTLALNNYRAVGGGDYTMFGEEKIIRTIEQDVVDLMISYIQSNLYVESHRENNFKVIGYENEI